ncbi:MAG: GntR family transcriptional regulator [Fibrobacter sp.]|jgi:DNA-binding transcriptional regulator YhcF (GntR family)|nr:GntR family transcriptional regulator [Fibrobacter sp.]
MARKRSPVLQDAIAKIRTLIEKSSDKSVLPSIRSLAKYLDVSPVTVIRAVDVLKGEGLISSRWGRGHFKAGEKTASKNDVKILEYGKYQKTLRKFKEDILKGTYKTYLPLPSINQLKATYNVSYPTIKKVLSTLLDEGILKLNGARYCFFTDRRKTNQRIVIVAFGLSRDMVKIETERERAFYRMLVSSAERFNVDIEIICYNDYLENPRFFTPGDMPFDHYLKRSGICGIILSSYHMNNSAACLSQLLTYNIPVSAWIEDSRILGTVERFGKHYKKLTFFDSSYSTIPGNDVGRYLLEKGHRHIAFISPFHGSPWSQNRLKGLKKALSSYPEASVYQFTVSEYSNDYFYLESVLEKDAFNHKYITDNIENQLHDFLAPRISVIKYEHDTLLRDNAIFTNIKRAVDQINSDPSITAIVCVNDLVACLITDYWNYNQVPFSKRPAIIGFDNSFGSFQRQISSYEFNTQGEIQNMISHLLYPDNSLFSGNKPVIRLSGRVIERASMYGH